MVQSRSARDFLERIGKRPTRRTPLLRVAPEELKVHSVPTTSLRSDIARVSEGEPPPDRGLTQEWPPQLTE